MKKLFFLITLVLFFSVGTFAQLGKSINSVNEFPSLTIAEARVDANADNIPDRKGDTVIVKGVIFTPNFGTTNTSYYIWDGTAGINLFWPTNVLKFAYGDSLVIVGYINHYRGLTEIQVYDTLLITRVKSGAALPTPNIITLTQFLANPEQYEASLIEVQNLSKKSGTWPAANSNASLVVTDGAVDATLYLDKDTDIDGSTEPTWPKDIIGVAEQYSSGSTVYNDGYELKPRELADILTVVPIELSSFSASVKENNVTLNWSTATETNNKGFEVYRNETFVKFVPGFGTSSEKRYYQFADNGLNNGNYTYKLVQVDYNGANKIVGTTEATVNSVPKEFTLSQNFPNPFNPSTSIKFALPVDSKVTLQIYNMIGQVVATLADGNYSAGTHNVNFNAANLTSGMYIYNMKALGIDGKTINATKKMTLVK